MSSLSYHIANLLEKMASADKDFRFMATNDLMIELQNDSIKLDDESERKVVKTLLRLVEDKNGEVQNLAVKCLGPLVGKVKEFQIDTIVDTICDNMLSTKEQLRDVSSIALKTVISELPVTSNTLISNVCKRITGKLASAVEKQDNVSVQLEALDILGDLLFRFGSMLVSFHPVILTSLLPQLGSQRGAVRKRTITCLGYLAVSCNMELYRKMINYLIDNLKNCNESSSLVVTYIQSLTAICRYAGHRFAEDIDTVLPIIMKFINKPNEEVRECCLQAFEVFVQKCPKEIINYIPQITDLALTYITYDPNYNYDIEDSSADDDGTMDLDENEDEEEDEDYSDDEDMSWKVRRSSAKCLETIILTRPELLVEFYKAVAPVLIARFKEREENVKSDIFAAFVALLKQTQPTTQKITDPDGMEHEDTPVAMLQALVPTLMKVIQPQMKLKSLKTRHDCFALLKELLVVLPGALTNYIQYITPGILYSLGDKNSSSTMKIEALSFLHLLFSSHKPEALYNYMGQLVPPVLSAVSDSFYKITAEALLVLQQVVKVLRPLEAPSSFDFTPYAGDIYQCTLSRLQATDIDQEVKEHAISCMGQIICSFGDCLQDKLPGCLPVFLDHLQNEITRLTTVKALIKIAGSPLNINLSPILEESVPLLGTFLRKNHRALKLSSLTLLNLLVKNYTNSLNSEMLEKVVNELGPLLSESDMHIAQLVLTLMTSIAPHHPGALTRVGGYVQNEILLLIKSPLLQGACLTAMLNFFKVTVNAGLPGLEYRELMALLIQPVVQSDSSGPYLHKQAYYSLAKCVGALANTSKQEGLNVANQFLRDVQSSTTESGQMFSLLVIAEIGREIDLSSIPNVEHIILNCFYSPSEEVKSSASYTFGSISMGNLNYFLPILLREIVQPKRQYLLLHSLKEIISCESSTSTGVQQLQPFLSEIWHHLFQHSECAEEGTRNVVAECLGKLCLTNPSVFLPRLQSALPSSSPLMCTTVITAIKFTISDHPQPIDPLLRNCIGEFLRLQDPDLNVRRVALDVFNSAVHNKPVLIRDLLTVLLPQLYSETKVKPELIREVEMGPFKHTIDDGLDIRKAAFECMYTLLETCLDRIDIFEFLNHVENGLKDHYDIKMLTYLMLGRMSHLCPTAVLQRLDRLFEPLRQTMILKVKANAVKQEYEKQDELKRSAVRAMLALANIPDAEKNPSFSEFMNLIKQNPELDAIFQSVQKDTSTTTSSSDNMMDIN